MPRIEIELTSCRPDGTWTWRAAGARQPKGSLEASVLPDGAKVGDVLRAEADFELEGILVRSTASTAPKRTEPERIAILGSGKEEPGVTTNLRTDVTGGERGGRPGGGGRDDRDRPRDGRGRPGGGLGRPDQGRPRQGQPGAGRGPQSGRPGGGPGSGGPGLDGRVSRTPDRGERARQDARSDRPDRPARPASEGPGGGPRSDRPARPTGDRPGADRPGVDRPGAERPGAERSGVDRPGAERPGAERSGAERSGAGRSGAGRSDAGRSGAERSGAERSGTGRSDAGRSGVGRDRVGGAAARTGRDGPGRGRPGGDRSDRPGRGPAPTGPTAPARPPAKRLSPGRVFRDAVIAELSPEQRVVAEHVLRGGLPAVRHAVEEQNAKARAVGGPEIKADALMTIAENLLLPLRAAEWRDRAEAAAADVEEISLRDLRAVVTGADVARDDEGRTIAVKLREALDRRGAAEQQAWIDEINTSLEAGRVVRALRLSGRPPEPSFRFPADLAARLSEAAGEALTADTTPDRWAAVLEAVVASPVRRTIKPSGVPAELGPELTKAIRLAAPRVPALAGVVPDDKSAGAHPHRPRGPRPSGPGGPGAPGAPRQAPTAPGAPGARTGPGRAGPPRPPGPPGPPRPARPAPPAPTSGAGTTTPVATEAAATEATATEPVASPGTEAAATDSAAEAAAEPARTEPAALSETATEPVASPGTDGAATDTPAEPAASSGAVTGSEHAALTEARTETGTEAAPSIGIDGTTPPSDAEWAASSVAEAVHGEVTPPTDERPVATLADVSEADLVASAGEPAVASFHDAEAEPDTERV